MTFVGRVAMREQKTSFGNGVVDEEVDDASELLVASVVNDVTVLHFETSPDLIDQGLRMSNPSRFCMTTVLQHCYWLEPKDTK